MYYNLKGNKACINPIEDSKGCKFIIQGDPHLCVPLFATLRFANSPLVALSNDEEFPRALDRGRFLKKAPQKLFWN